MCVYVFPGTANGAQCGVLIIHSTTAVFLETSSIGGWVVTFPLCCILAFREVEYDRPHLILFQRKFLVAIVVIHGDVLQ